MVGDPETNMEHTKRKHMGMKKAAVWATVLMLLLGGCGKASRSCELLAEDDGTERGGSYTPGDYCADAWGFGGAVTVQMTFSEKGILCLRIDGPDESSKGARAIVKLAHAIMDEQSPEVDAVSGATMTSNAVLKAAGKCFSQAAAGRDTEETSE